MPFIEKVHHLLIEQRKTLALAESCTGGALSAAFVRIPGASHYLLGSLVVYSNEWKKLFLGLSSETLENHGAVSKEAVEEMVQALLTRTTADYAIAISGILGPSGGNSKKPVGTVFIGVGDRKRGVEVEKVKAPPNRGAAIEFIVQKASEALLLRIRSDP